MSYVTIYKDYYCEGKWAEERGNEVNIFYFGIINVVT